MSGTWGAVGVGSTFFHLLEPLRAWRNWGSELEGAGLHWEEHRSCIGVVPPLGWLFQRGC